MNNDNYELKKEDCTLIAATGGAINLNKPDGGPEMESGTGAFVMLYGLFTRTFNNAERGIFFGFVCYGALLCVL